MQREEARTISCLSLCNMPPQIQWLLNNTHLLTDFCRLKVRLSMARVCLGSHKAEVEVSVSCVLIWNLESSSKLIPIIGRIQFFVVVD